MEDANRLSTILSILSGHWDNLSEGMTQDQLLTLKNDITELEKKVENSKNAMDIESAASEFLTSISQFEPLSQIMDKKGIKMRSGSLPLPENEIRIKIINYCAILNDKIIIKKNED